MCSIDLFDFSKDDVGKGILPLDRLAGVCAYAPRVCRSRLMALQESAKVEYARLPARRKELRAFSRVRLSRCQVSSFRHSRRIKDYVGARKKNERKKDRE